MSEIKPNKTKDISESVRKENTKYSDFMLEILENSELKDEGKKIQKELLGVVDKIEAIYQQKFDYEQARFFKKGIEKRLDRVRKSIENNNYWGAVNEVMKLEDSAPLSNFLPQS